MTNLAAALQELKTQDPLANKSVACQEPSSVLKNGYTRYVIDGVRGKVNCDRFTSRGIRVSLLSSTRHQIALDFPPPPKARSKAQLVLLGVLSFVVVLFLLMRLR